jgi:hypothetical protein
VLMGVHGPRLRDSVRRYSTYNYLTLGRCIQLQCGPQVDRGGSALVCSTRYLGRCYLVEVSY